MKALVKLTKEYQDLNKKSLEVMDFPADTIEKAVAQFDREVVMELRDGEVYLCDQHIPSKYCEYIHVQGLRQRYE